MIDILFTLILLCIVFGVLYWLVNELGLPDPFNKIIRVCMILIAIIMVVGLFTGHVESPHFVTVKTSG